MGRGFTGRGPWGRGFTGIFEFWQIQNWINVFWRVRGATPLIYSLTKNQRWPQLWSQYNFAGEGHVSKKKQLLGLWIFQMCLSFEKLRTNIEVLWFRWGSKPSKRVDLGEIYNVGMLFFFTRIVVFRLSFEILWFKRGLKTLKMSRLVLRINFEILRFRWGLKKWQQNDQILTSQNWCPFGPRTVPSIFRDTFGFAGGKPAKKSQNFTAPKMHEKYGFQC